MKPLSPERALHELLVALFDTADLRQWIEYDIDLRVIAPELPGHTASMAELTSKVVRSVVKHGFVGQGFFDRLRHVRPNRVDYIDEVAGLWLVVQEVFPPSPTFVDSAPVDDAPMEQLGIDIDNIDLESVTALEVLGSPHQDLLLSAIADLTRTPRKRVINALASAPKLTVRDVFSDKWPNPDDLLTLKVSHARRLHLTATIAKHVGWPAEKLRELLAGEHGNTLLSRIVTRPQQGPVPTSSLGTLTLAEVDRRGLRETMIAFLEERGLMKQTGVTRRFNSNQGNALVRNVFPEILRDEWPEVT